ncbi:unnamed protein product [Gadus morhua 'NCC']
MAPCQSDSPPRSSRQPGLILSFLATTTTTTPTTPTTTTTTTKPPTSSTTTNNSDTRVLHNLPSHPHKVKGGKLGRSIMRRGAAAADTLISLAVRRHVSSILGAHNGGTPRQNRLSPGPEMEGASGAQGVPENAVQYGRAHLGPHGAPP